MVLPRSGGLRARAVIRYIVSVLSRVLTAGSVSALVASKVVALMEKKHGNTLEQFRCILECRSNPGEAYLVFSSLGEVPFSRGNPWLAPNPTFAFSTSLKIYVWWSPAAERKR